MKSLLRRPSYTAPVKEAGRFLGLPQSWRATMVVLCCSLSNQHRFLHAAQVLILCITLAEAVTTDDGNGSCENMNYYGICDAESRKSITFWTSLTIIILILLEILGIKVDITNADALAALQKSDIKRAYYKQVTMRHFVVVSRSKNTFLTDTGSSVAPRQKQESRGPK